MRFVRAAKRLAVSLIAPTLFLGLTGYFIWNASRGEHGLRNSALRRVQLVAEQQALATAEADRQAWQIKVAGLRDAHIDPDTLDERARAEAQVANPADLVVPYGKKLY